MSAGCTPVPNIYATMHVYIVPGTAPVYSTVYRYWHSTDTQYCVPNLWRSVMDDNCCTVLHLNVWFCASQRTETAKWKRIRWTIRIVQVCFTNTEQISTYNAIYNSHFNSHCINPMGFIIINGDYLHSRTLPETARSTSSFVSCETHT